jgi:hypothetical protein
MKSEPKAMVRRLPAGQRVGSRTLRNRLACRPVLWFSRLEKAEGMYPLINAVSVSPLQVVEEES